MHILFRRIWFDRFANIFLDDLEISRGLKNPKGFCMYNRARKRGKTRG